MKNTNPTVSIGLAVFNGDRYLAQAIESILNQTYTDFELIISDNASTDNTEEICKRYAAQDDRIIYHRNPKNIGGANNENLTFKLSKGKYFRWAAHDDVCHPELLENLVAGLESAPDIVLSESMVVKIDADDQPVGFLHSNDISDDPYDRFVYLSRWDHECEATYGLIRSEIMKKTDLELNYTDSDRTFLCELGLYGRFHRVPKYLFYKRFHPDMSTNVYTDWRLRMEWFGLDPYQIIAQPYLMQFFHYLRIIRRAPVSIITKVRCYLYMGKWIFDYDRYKAIFKDGLISLKRFYKIRLRRVFN